MEKLRYVGVAGSDIEDKQADDYASYLVDENKKNDDIIVDDLILQATNSKSGYHDKFEWDNRKAAEMWLNIRAKQLLDNIHQIGDDEQRVPLSEIVDLDIAHIITLARKKNSPIQAFFEWDEVEGATKYRKHLALKLIRRDRKQTST